MKGFFKLSFIALYSVSGFSPGMTILFGSRFTGSFQTTGLKCEPNCTTEIR